MLQCLLVFEYIFMFQIVNCAYRCSILGQLGLTKNASARVGLMSDFSIEWSASNNSTKMETSTSTVDKGRSFDENRRVVYHSLETGGGYESLSSFCSIMNMPCVSKQAYYKQVGIILEAQVKLRQSCRKQGKNCKISSMRRMKLILIRMKRQTRTIITLLMSLLVLMEHWLKEDSLLVFSLLCLLILERYWITIFSPSFIKSVRRRKMSAKMI